MMPFSEFNSAAKGKLDPTQPKMTNCSAELSSFVPDHEFIELLWENGQIVMQGQSNRPKKSSLPSVFPSHAAKAQEKEGRDAVTHKTGRLGAIDSIANDFSAATGSPGHIGLNDQDEEMVPWLNYPIDDDDYCSEFLSEFSGVNMNSLSTHNTTLPVDRISSFTQPVRDTHNLENGNASRAPTGGSELSKMRNDPLFQSPQQCQNLIPSSRPRESDFCLGNSTSVHQSPCGDLPTTKMAKQDMASTKPMQHGSSSSSKGVVNFSHFSRPAALVKSNLQNADKLRSSKPVESTPIESASGLKSVSGGQLALVTPKVGLKSITQPPQEVVSVEASEAICQEDASRKNHHHHHNNDTKNNQRSPDRMKYQGLSFTANAAAGRHVTEKGPEPVVASSSVCSGNGDAGAASNEAKNRAKRKSHEGEESGYQSEQDPEDESLGVRKHVTGRGTNTKRTRAAEVHNLSERRRRDRINEKMRALQELIPNCNKVDKASMLDEAIEYLKTLQMQVQMMSMGNGLCIAPMMLPAGMRHIRTPRMGPFSPMGVGIGMGMGLSFGMGMLDMTGSPLIPLSPMHGPQFPCSSAPRTTGLHGMPGSTSLQMFGIHGSGLPMSMPRPPPFVPLSGIATKVNPAPETSGVEASLVTAADSAPPSSKDQSLQTSNLETTRKTGADNSQIQTSTTQATKECFEQSSIVQINNQTSDNGGSEAIDSGNGISSITTTSFDR